MFLHLLLAKSDGTTYEDEVDDNKEVALENNGEMIYFSPCDDKGINPLYRPGETFEICVCHVDHNDDCQKKRLVKLQRYASILRAPLGALRSLSGGLQ